MAESSASSDATRSSPRNNQIEDANGNDSQSPLSKSTKIVATLGPASSSPDIMRSLMIAGVNVFRLNFSHGTQAEKASLIVQIRSLSKSMSLYVAILADLQGPKFRLGETSDHQPIKLMKGQSIRFRSGEMQSTSDSQALVTGTKHAHTLLPHLQIGHRILINDGAIVLRVESRQSNREVTCSVLVGGPCGERKGVNVPDLEVPMPALTEKDIDDAKFAMSHDVDYFALSFVQRAQDVLDLKALISATIAETNRAHPLIIAKIEKPQAIPVIDSIITVVDGVMVARGDLGVEASFWTVPAVQKLLIAKCNEMNKPVIVATQMIESMIENPQPTRAEASDIFNAVYDGADATMLSAESASGKFPVEAVQAMSQIVREAEKNQRLLTKSIAVDAIIAGNGGERRFDYSIVNAAVSAASHGLNAKALILVTVSYELALYVSKLRPSCPIIVVTFSEKLAAMTGLLYGCHAVLMDEHLASSQSSTDAFLSSLERAIHDRKYLALADNIVLACGDAPVIGLRYSVQLAKFGSFGLTKSVSQRKWSHLINEYHAKSAAEQHQLQTGNGSGGIGINENVGASASQATSSYIE